MILITRTSISLVIIHADHHEHQHGTSSQATTPVVAPQIMIIQKITATKLQAASYLLGVALFSISFLVFLNASISFVVTDVIGRKHGVGDIVGTLGFADELVALVACPLWGLLSDKIGVRNVAVVGYLIIGASLMLLVQSHNDIQRWRRCLFDHGYRYLTYYDGGEETDKFSGSWSDSRRR
jgi:nitrate/nitrite transporter NarK